MLGGRLGSVVLVKLLAASLAMSACLQENDAWVGETDAVETGVTSTTSTSGTTEAGATGSGESSGASSTTSEGTGSTGNIPPAADPCLPLEPPERSVLVNPVDAANLEDILESQAPGTTVELQDGVYEVSSIVPIRIEIEGLTLRSASGDPSSVIIDGGGAPANTIAIEASDVTIAELTLRNSSGSLVGVRPGKETITGTVIYRVHFEDARAYQVEVRESEPAYADNGTLACSRFIINDEFRSVSPCGFGAVHLEAAAGWTISDNVVQGHWCQDFEAVPSLSVQGSSRNTRIERNLFLDNFLAMQLGDDGSSADRTYRDSACDPAEYWGHIGGEARNNIVWVGSEHIMLSSPPPDAMIRVDAVCDMVVQHNTVVSLFDVASSIEYGGSQTTMVLANNLTTNMILPRDGAAASSLDTNLTVSSLDAFIDAQGADLHLSDSSPAIDAATPLPDYPVVLDFDLEERDANPDIGADER